MSRYIIKFKKQGYLKYTSHLDIMRFFERTFKRAEIKLLYSQGFNPHPKMSIAQPLSLGYTSTGDYIEIETAAVFVPEEMMENLNRLMPLGMEIICIKSIGQGKKTLASQVSYGEYEVSLPFDQNRDATEIDAFMLQTKIEIVKLQRKTGLESIVDLKPLIHTLTYKLLDGHIMLTMLIRNGSTANLNPELLIQALSNYTKWEVLYSEVLINRKDLYYSKDGELIKLEDYKI